MNASIAHTAVEAIQTFLAADPDYQQGLATAIDVGAEPEACLLYTSPSPRDRG